MKQFIIYLLLLISSPLFASNSQELAQAAYEQQEYQTAQIHYEQLLQQFPLSPDILYNLGNVHFKQDQLGKSIGYYRKALSLAPLNSDIRYNLRLARQFVVDDITSSTSLWTKLSNSLSYMSLNNSFYLFMLSLFLLTAIAYKWTQSKQKKELWMNLCVTAAIVTLLCGSIFTSKYTAHHKHFAVVLAKKTAVHSGPSDTLSILFYIHEGHELTVITETEYWYEIELDNGFKGWVQREQLFSI